MPSVQPHQSAPALVVSSYSFGRTVLVLPSNKLSVQPNRRYDQRARYAKESDPTDTKDRRGPRVSTICRSSLLAAQIECIWAIVSAHHASLSIIDRYHGEKSLGKMFWKNVGPKTPNSALACSVAHDHHNLWVLGSSDEAMALAINELAAMQGGWVLVNNGAIVARVFFEIGGLMTARPAEILAAELKELWSQGDKMEWHGPQGFPRLMIFATSTCTPWHWVLVVPQPDFPNGFINVTTGETHPVVW